MKDTALRDLPIVPEDYESSHYERVDYSALHSEMTEIERRFINGLIRWYQPTNLIEIGVSRGGGTVNLLNAISDVADSKLVSIDRLSYSYADKRELNRFVPVGEDVYAVFPEATDGKWELIAGKDPAEVLDYLPIRYDFAVIDTMHVHPVESLNFLTLLPYLNDGAIVVLHDVSLHLRRYDRPNSLATRILMSTVAGHKITHSSDGSIPNIVAIQITQDTRNYIENVFDSLFLPWKTLVQDAEAIGELLKKHYTTSQISKYYEAVKYNKVSFCYGKMVETCAIKKMWNDIATKHKEEIIFYGAGTRMRGVLSHLSDLSIPFCFPIWDIDAQIKKLGDHTVCEPDFTTTVSGKKYMVVTIVDAKTANEVKTRFESLGYTVYLGISGLMEAVSNNELN